MKPQYILLSSDPLLAGSWYEMPVTDTGFYDLRRIFRPPTGASGLYCEFLPARRVYENSGGQLLCMGRRISRMTPADGWQFRFLRQLSNGVPINWRPRVVSYGPRNPSRVVGVEKRDITGQLPLAHSVEEARHIVRLIPTRWPVFTHLHVEYVEEKVQ